REAGGSVPRLYVLPFVFSVRLTMDHPLIKALERDSSRCGIGEYRRRAPAPMPVQNGVVSLEGCFTIGNDQQCRTVAVQPGYLQVPSILANVWIVKRTGRVRLFQRAVVEHVIKDHGDAQRSNLDRLCRTIAQRETQDQSALVHYPSSCDPEREFSRQG